MKTASLKELRDELKVYPAGQLQDLCLRLAKFKKENKELLAYLLFEAENEQNFIQSVKNEMDTAFDGMNRGNIFFIRKSLRKILRDTNKYIKFSGIKTTELDLAIYFCRKIRQSKIPLSRHVALKNLYARQVMRVEKTLDKLHEDVQFDYRDDLAFLKA
jgi:hypothetical protein